jgi:hypothetical protein
MKISGKGTGVRDWLAMMSIAAGVLLIMTMIAYVLFEENGAYLLIDWCFILSTIAVFILSILHLKRYQEKGFAVTMLVISSIFVFMFFMAMLIGFIIGFMG